MTETIEEIRRHPRFQRPRPVVVGGAGAADCGYVVLDVVSRGGGELRGCQSELTPDDLVDLEICLSGGVIRTRARVVECRGVPGDYRIGVEFLAMPEDQVPLLQALLADCD